MRMDILVSIFVGISASELVSPDPVCCRISIPSLRSLGLLISDGIRDLATAVDYHVIQSH